MNLAKNSRNLQSCCVKSFLEHGKMSNVKNDSNDYKS
jgi:hypothetical protein